MDVELREVLCAGAWRLFEQNEPAAFAQAIAACFELEAGDAEVVMLAHASMAAAADLCRDLDVPVLNSPRLGLEAALSAMSNEQ